MDEEISGRPIMDDAQVLEFEAFYDEWFPKVYNYARHRTGSPTAADDIVSETFTRALECWHRFDPAEGGRGPWLLGIARHLMSDRYRSWRRWVWTGLLELLDRPEPGPGPAAAAEASEESGRLLRALSGLDERARDIVCLRYHADMTNRSIAALLGLTEGNVAIILMRSLRRLRESLEKEAGGHA